jgi:predicted DNA-binding transcriptional regulator YafY
MGRSNDARCHISFDYAKDEGSKLYTAVVPFKLMNHKGIWYLVPDGDKIKTFSFAKIERLSQFDTQGH